jgi:hypothetical protein
MRRYFSCKFEHFICLIKGAFVGENNFNIIKMHGTTIKNIATVINVVHRLTSLQHFPSLLLFLPDLFPNKYTTLGTLHLCIDRTGNGST